MFLGLLAGDAGGLSSYALIGSVAVAANAWAWWNRGRYWPFAGIAATVASFVASRSLLEAGSALWESAFLVAYVLAAVVFVGIVRARVETFRLESVLEAAMIAAGSLLFLTQAWVLTNAASGVTVFTFLAPVLVFVLGLGYLGRGRSGPAMRWWFVAGMCALLSEIPYAISEDVRFVAEARTHLGALAFIPLSVAALYPPPEKVAGIPERREVGIFQVSTILLLLVLPLILLTQLARGANGAETAALVLLAGIAVMATVVGRFWLLIRRRDWSNHCDQVLAQLGEDLVLVSNESEAAAAVVGAATKMAPDGPIAAQLVATNPDAQPAATATARVGGRSLSELETPSDNRPSTIIASLSRITRSSVSVLSSSAGGFELFVGTLTSHAIDLKPYVRTLAAQHALVLESLRAREETHRARANQRMRALVQDSSDVILLVDADTGLVVFASPNVKSVIGLADEELIGADPLSILDVEDEAFAKDALDRADHPGENDASNDAPGLDVRATHVEGHQHWLSLSVRDYTEDPEVQGLVYNFADINERKLAELQLGSSELQYRTMVMNASDVFAVIDTDATITFISPNIERLLGMNASDLIGTDFRGLFSSDGRRSYDRYRQRFEQGVGSEVADIEVRTGLGNTMIAEVELARPAELGDSLMVSMRDVTENRELAENVRAGRESDELTGLLNRHGLQDRLTSILETMGRDQYLATVTLDINDFSKINENLGYLGGDELLVNVAARLRKQMRNGDALSRQSGDEFTVLSVHESKAAGDAFGERVANIFEEPFMVGGRSVRVKASIGSIVTDDVQGASKRVLEASKMALNFAKADRHKRHVVFENWMREEASVHFDIALDLAEAMRSGEIHLAFQPIMSLSNNRVRTVEALLRWQHPVHGNVSPGVFVPIAERSGEIVELGRWALDRACRQTKTWNDSLPGGMNLGVSVNLSLLQLEDLSEAEMLQSIVRDSQIDPRHVMIELTESVMITDPGLLRRQLDGFRRLGCKIAVDDFGSGVAGMSHLHDAGHIDVLKIDRRYIEGVDRRDDARTIVSGVIDLAHRMGAKAIAEGIETPPQADALRRLSCDYGQGFYLGRPMVANRIEKWFSQGWKGQIPALIDRSDTW